PDRHADPPPPRSQRTAFRTPQPAARHNPQPGSARPASARTGPTRREDVSGIRTPGGGNPAAGRRDPARGPPPSSPRQSPVASSPREKPALPRARPPGEPALPESPPPGTPPPRCPVGKRLATGGPGGRRGKGAGGGGMRGA